MYSSRRLVVRVRRLHGLLGARHLPALARDDAVVGEVGERPVLHAVHAVVAAHHGADRAVAHRRHLGLQAGDVLERGARRGVASVKERMHHDLPGGVLLARALHELEEVLLVGVHALVLQEAEEVQLARVLLPVVHQVRPLRALEELARGEAVVDALELLHDDTAGAHVEVPHLGTALVAVRQAHGLAAAVQQAMRIARADLVNHRRLRRHHGIALVVFIDAPSVADDQYDWSHNLFFLFSF